MGRVCNGKDRGSHYAPAMLRLFAWRSCMDLPRTQASLQISEQPASGATEEAILHVGGIDRQWPLQPRGIAFDCEADKAAVG